MDTQHYVEQEALPPRKPLQDPELRNGLKAKKLLAGTELQNAQIVTWNALQGNPSDNAELIALLGNLQVSLGFIPLRPSNNLSELTNLADAFANLGFSPDDVNDVFLWRTGGRLSGQLSINSVYPLLLIANDLPANESRGTMEFDGRQVFFTITNDRGAIPLNMNEKDTSITIANSTTESDVFSTDMLANTFAVGKIIRLLLFGRYSTANGVDTVTIRFKVNGTTILSAVSTGAAVANAPLTLTLSSTIRSLGAGGTLWGYLEAVINNVLKHATATATTAIDTTVDCTFKATVQWSNADPGNTISIDQALLNAS